MQSFTTARRETAPRTRWGVALGAAALTLPLVFTPAIASATAPAAPYGPADGLAAIKAQSYLPDFVQEYADQTSSANVFEHVRHLAVDIGPRVAGTSAEVAANAYVQQQLSSFGFQTEIEEFPLTASTYANATPDRDLATQASWQYQPATGSLMTGPNAPVTGGVIDVGTGVSLPTDELAGKFVLMDAPAVTTDRAARVAAIAEAGAAGIIVTDTNPKRGLAEDFSVPAEAVNTVVVRAAQVQSERIRALLVDGPLNLSMTTEHTGTVSSNVIGVRPAVGDTDGTAPIVYIGAHVDSVVGSPGASDNASGVGIMLETARILGQYDLNTEIRVGSWGAEERGILGSKVHANSLTPAEIERTIGAWNMDMAGTGFPGTEDKPFKFWGLTVNPDNTDHPVLDLANATSESTDRGPLNRGSVGRSDHQSFHDVGIKAAVFSWMFWSQSSSIVLEPTYHIPSDTIDFVSEERMGISAEIIGGSAFRGAMNSVSVRVEDENGDPAAGTQVAMSCGDDEGWRAVGTTSEDGKVATLAPTLSCDFAALSAERGTGGAVDQAISGATEVTLKLVQDTEAPAVSITPSVEATAAGWYPGGVTVAVAAEDNMDEAPVVEYSLSGVDWLPYTEAIALPAEGNTTLHARATDGAGNVATDSREFKVDASTPTLEITQNPAKRGEVTITATGGASGIGAVEYRVLPSDDWTAAPAAPSAPAAPASSATAQRMASADVAPAAAPAEVRTVQLPLGNAAATVEFRATSAAGVQSEVQTLEFAAAEPGTPVDPKPVDPKPVDPAKPGPTPGTATAGAAAGGLANTGGEPLLWIGAATALLLLSGVGAVVIARRRALQQEQ